mgnify:FL=1
MPLQTIFAEEFTSGNQDVVSEEETPEIFTNEELEAAGETDEELSVFSSDEVPEFNDAPMRQWLLRKMNKLEKLI